MTRWGRRLATGRTSDLFAYGSGSVAKVLREGVPPEWAEVEFQLARRVHPLDIPTPEPRDLVSIDGRAAVIFERVDGPSMQQSILDGAMTVTAAADLLAGIHQQILACPAPDGMPAAAARLSVKIGSVEVISASEREEGQRLVAAMPTADRLLHGDLHPNNVILATSGPVVIDWYDASVGHPVSDIARSKLLMRSPDTELERKLAAQGGDGAPHAPHLPGATVELLDAIRGRYLERMSGVLDESGIDDHVWQTCLAVTALGRVAEQIRPDDGPLLEIWRSRPEPVSS